jgi:ElaB/YqjD/DUF883 family membrane-anchored ribosome-binding protein
MATTTDMAPNRSSSTTSPRRASANGTSRSTSRSRSRRTREDDLEAQIGRLQNDLKSIGATIATMADNKVGEARVVAKREARNLAQQGQDAVDGIQDEFGEMEKQIKDTIREKPLTAVAGAIALGFVLALVTR